MSVLRRSFFPVQSFALCVAVIQRGFSVSLFKEALWS